MGLLFFVSIFQFQEALWLFKVIIHKTIFVKTIDKWIFMRYNTTNK